MGGVASAILELNIPNIEVVSFEYEDAFITHGNTDLVEASLKIRAEDLAIKVKEYISNSKMLVG
jgi:1-deoxy-D-xylulose-5-phosphate synthase